MTKTKLKNETGIDVTLKEGTAGILRKICDLKNGHHFTVSSELNQTYKEYWCIGHGSDQFTLSSDDLLDWKEIVIKPTPSDLTKFHWEGIPRKLQGTEICTLPEPSGTAPASSVPPPHPSFLSKLSNKVFGLFSRPKPLGTVITTTITNDPATTTTIITTDADTANSTATSASHTDAATPAATTTVTITSTTLATTAPSTTA